MCAMFVIVKRAFKSHCKLKHTHHTPNNYYLHDPHQQNTPSSPQHKHKRTNKQEKNMRSKKKKKKKKKKKRKKKKKKENIDVEYLQQKNL